MQGVGLIEVAAGLVVATKPKWGRYVVSAWLLGIIANLWTKPQYRDIALRDFGLALGAPRLGAWRPTCRAMSHARNCQRNRGRHPLNGLAEA